MNVLRVCIIVIAGIGMIGFGLCGAWGLVAGLSGPRELGPIPAIFGAIGLGVALALFFLVRVELRNMRKEPPQ